jgi:cytochrome c oxidase subunit 4
MSDSHNPEEFQHHVKRYLFVFYALIVGTIVTVWVSRWHIESVALTIAIALLIACIKGFLVAGYFMHLISEKKMIYGILLATGFFFVGLMFLTVWSMNHNSLVHIQP